MKCPNGVLVDGTEAISVLLKRFAYPYRFADMVARFGRPVPQLCMITNRMIDYLFDEYSHLLADLNQPWLSRDLLRHFAATIHDKGAPLENCWGFIDGTVRPLCKPDENQRILYNGHKRVHGIKFQSVVAPNGLITSVFGPVEGRRHDSGMLVDSGLLQELSHYSFAPDGTPLCVYGDPAYPLRVHLQGSFKRRSFDTSRATVQQGHEPSQSFGKMAIWGHCKLFCIPRFQEKLKNRLKSFWQNVHCVGALKKRSQLSLSVKYFEVFRNRSTPNPGLFQLGF